MTKWGKQKMPAELTESKLRLSALNSTKTGYSAFVFEADKYFENYSFVISKEGPASRNVRSDRFCCQIYLKVTSATVISVNWFLGGDLY